MGIEADPYNLTRSITVHRITGHDNAPTAHQLLGDSNIATVAFACPYSASTTYGEDVGDLGLNYDDDSAIVTFGADGRFLGVARTGAVNVDVCPIWDTALADVVFPGDSGGPAPRFDADLPLTFRNDGGTYTLIGVGEWPDRAGQDAPARP